MNTAVSPVVAEQSKAAEGSASDYIALRRAQVAQPTGAIRPTANSRADPETTAKADAGTAAEPTERDEAAAASTSEAAPSDGNGKSDKPGGDSNLDEGDPPAGKADESKAGESSPAKEAAGDGKPDKPGEPARDDAWLKRRLNRQRRSDQRKHQAELAGRNDELERLRRQNAELRQGASQPSQGVEDINTYYPGRADYTDEASHKAAVDVWSNGADTKGMLAGMTPAARQRFESAQAPAETREAPALSPEEQAKQRKAQVRQNEVLSTLEDTYDAIEDLASPDLAEQFREGISLTESSKQIKVSKAMLDYLVDSDDVHIVAKAFVDKPRLARNICRKRTIKEQVAALKSLVMSLKGPASKSPAETRKAPPVPDLDDSLSHGKPNLPTQELHDMSAAAYIAQRRKQERGKGTGVFA